MSVVFLIWLLGVLAIQPITKRILKEHDKHYARYRDDEREFLLLLSERND
jgi:hypothetical protein